MQENKLLYGIDLDGICFDFCKGFRSWIDDKLHIHLEKEEITSYYWYETSTKINKSQFMEEFDKFGLAGGYRHLELLPNAIEMLHRIKAAGHELVYITNRPMYAYNDTCEALNAAQFPDRHRLHFATGAKAPVINELDVNVFIDDSPRTIEEISVNTKARIYCMDYPFNRNLLPGRYTRVHSLLDFLSHEGIK